VPDLTPDSFAREVIASYVARLLKNRLLFIRSEYRNCPAARTGSQPGEAAEAT